MFNCNISVVSGVAKLVVLWSWYQSFKKIFYAETINLSISIWKAKFFIYLFFVQNLFFVKKSYKLQSEILSKLLSILSQKSGWFCIIEQKPHLIIHITETVKEKIYELILLIKIKQPIVMSRLSIQNKGQSSCRTREPSMIC